jgi:t-SNARE complex subunit (syntaxin)
MSAPKPAEERLTDEEIALRDAVIARAKRFFLVWTIVKILVIAIIVVAAARFLR